MRQNPYAAPKAPVSDMENAPDVMTRPKQVVWTVWITVANVALGLVFMALNWSYYARMGSIPAIIGGQIVGLAINFWLYYKIWQGRNWARIVLLVFSVLGFMAWALPTTRGVMAAAPTVVRVGSILGLVSNVVVIWLLFFSPGKVWFRRND